MIKNREYCKYTYLHRKALEYYIQKNILLTWEEKDSLLERARIHDMDKMLLYFFWEKEAASKYHREHSSHHLTKWKDYSYYDLLESIFDYECAALTKPDKPLNAYDTVLKYYSEFREDYLPILKRLDMDSSYLAVSEKDKEFINQFNPTEEDILKELANYLLETQDELYNELWDELCSKEEYIALKKLLWLH